MPEHRPLEMSGWDIRQPQALSQFLASLPASPRLLALGEPTHGIQDFPRWRNRILQVLVQKHGFRSIAIESDVLAGPKVNNYALGGPGTLDEVMSTGLSHGFGEYAANRELVAWLREYNAGRPDAARVHFYGFDAPMENYWAASPRACLLTLHGFLAAHLGELPTDAATIEELCGDDARWTNEAAAMNPAQSVGGTAEAKVLRLLADDLNNLLEQEAPRLGEKSGFWLAKLHARTALGLLRYHSVMAQESPNRIARLLAQRDLMMADNLSAVLEREQGRGPTLVFAHNLHLQRGISGMNIASLSGRVEWWGAGAHLHTRLGQHYAFIASTLGGGEWVPTPAPDTLEGFLSGQTHTPTLYATRHQPFPGTIKRRTDTDYRFQALRPETLHEADGLLFLPTTQENA